MWSCDCFKGGAVIIPFFSPLPFILLSFFQVEDDLLVYTNTLFHTPTLNRFGIVRSAGMASPLECHYKRLVWGLFQHSCYTYLCTNTQLRTFCYKSTSVCTEFDRDVCIVLI